MSPHRNTYVNQSPGQIQPPSQMGQPMMMNSRRAMNSIGRAKSIFPKWLTRYPIAAYLLALMVVTFMYSAHSLPWYHMLAGIVSVLIFFLYGSKVVQDTTIERIRKEKNFEKRIFIIAFIPRLLFMLLIYWIFQENYGNAFGFENADATYYNDLGQFVAGMIEGGDYHFYDAISKWSGNEDIADMGYGVYVGFIYWLTDNSLIAVRVLKCIISSISVVLVYRLAKRNFGDQTARVAAIFVALWPNFWYYCGTHLKETEMVFLAVLFVEQADQMLRSRQFTAWKVIPILLMAAILFTFRTPLGLVALLALIFSLVMSSSKVLSWGKRIIVSILVILLVGVTVGNRIEEKARVLVEQASQTGYQKSNLEWRSKREHGNAFAKYAGIAVFAPMIFTLPFPTLAHASEDQNMQELFNGGNFIKNIFSAFTIFAIVILLLSGKWREYLLPLSFILGYLIVLVMSSFPHSERFHQPVMPFELMFAAYGLSIAVTKLKYKRWFTYWCVFIFFVAVAWNWFKLAGRGLA